MRFTSVPDELLRLTPSDLERMSADHLAKIRKAANTIYRWTEDEADRVLIRGIMEMVNREMERRLTLYESKERLG